MSRAGNCAADGPDRGRRGLVTAAAALAVAGVGRAPAAEPEGMTVAVLTHAGGAHLSIYFRALADAPAVGPVVVIDPDGASFEEARTILGVKLRATGGDLVEVLARERPTLALVSMEARLAPAAIRAALEAGCHVVAEKPACVAEEAFTTLADFASARGLHLMLALANRLDPRVVEARRRIDAGEVGRVVALEMHLVQDRTRLTRPAYQQGWFADPNRAGGGHLAWLGIHWLDLAMHLTGRRVEEVAAFTANVGGETVAIEDSAVVTMRFAGNAVGTLAGGYWLDAGYQSHLRIWGTRGWLSLDDGVEPVLRVRVDGGSPGGEVIRTAEGRDPYGAFVNAAVAAAAGLASPPIDTAESLRAIETVFGIYRAARLGRSVAIGREPPASPQRPSTNR